MKGIPSSPVADLETDLEEFDIWGHAKLTSLTNLETDCGESGDLGEVGRMGGCQAHQSHRFRS